MLTAMIFAVTLMMLGVAVAANGICFSGDYTASGALKSLMSAGVRIPDDVRVIAWSNRGNGPVFPFPVDYAQLDPYAHGRVIVCGVLSALHGDGFPNKQFLDSVCLTSQTTKE